MLHENSIYSLPRMTSQLNAGKMSGDGEHPAVRDNSPASFPTLDIAGLFAGFAADILHRRRPLPLPQPPPPGPPSFLSWRKPPSPLMCLPCLPPNSSSPPMPSSSGRSSPRSPRRRPLPAPTIAPVCFGPALMCCLRCEDMVSVTGVGKE